MKRLAVLAVSVGLAGCVSTEEPVQIGKDTYEISTDASGPGSGLMTRGKLLHRNVKAASAFCARQGKVIDVQHTESSGIAGFTPVSGDMVFHCYAENDPDYKRLQMKHEANVRIENGDR